MTGLLTCVQIWSRPKWAQVIASQRKCTQALAKEGVASRPKFPTCESVWLGLNPFQVNCKELRKWCRSCSLACLQVKQSFGCTILGLFFGDLKSLMFNPSGARAHHCAEGDPFHYFSGVKWFLNTRLWFVTSPRDLEGWKRWYSTNISFSQPWRTLWIVLVVLPGLSPSQAEFRLYNTWVVLGNLKNFRSTRSHNHGSARMPGLTISVSVMAPGSTHLELVHLRARSYIESVSAVRAVHCNVKFSVPNHLDMRALVQNITRFSVEWNFPLYLT